jgi:hypothetical protein
MALEGDLSEFPLTDIVQLLDLSKKTGGVHIHGRRGSQLFDGWLYFRDGKVISAELMGLAPLESAYTFFTFSAGPFRFYDGKTPEAQTITVSNEVIIMEGVMRQDAWAAIQEQVPSLTMVPRLVPNPSSGSSEISLEAEEWRVLTMVNGKNTVEQIARRSGLGEFRTCEIIAQLLANGLIEKRETNIAEVLLPELERLAITQLGSTGRVLLLESYKRASIRDVPNATGDQLLDGVDAFEQAVTLLLGPARARQLTTDMRAAIQHLM